MDIFDNNQYSHQIFISIILNNQTFRNIEFTDCTFKQSDFLECTFYKCSFQNCTFTNCVLSAIKVTNSKFINVLFNSSKILSVDWTKAGGLTSKVPLSISFNTCRINFSSFFGLSLNHLIINQSIAQEVDFSETDLTEAIFTDTDFAGSKFLHTNLTGADFTNAKNYLIDPRANKIKKAKFCLPEAISLLNCLDIILN